MEFLSTMFFILTPFGLFCTGNGTGLITGTVFLLLGFLFRWIADGGLERATATKVSSETFWRMHFTNRYYGSGNVTENLNRPYISPEDAKGWADDVTRANGGIPPSDERFEEIAKELGIETRKARLEKLRNDRLYALAVFSVLDDVKEQFLKELKPNQHEERRVLDQLYWTMFQKLRTTPNGSRITWIEVKNEGGKEGLLKKISNQYAEDLMVWEEKLKKYWTNEIFEKKHWVLTRRK